MTDKLAAGYELHWFKSSYSNSEPDSSCVEVAAAPGTVRVRDSKDVGGPQLAVPSPAWAAFVGFAARG
ncbi:DUF397 domain-containing protein [Streptomyces sp. JJ38]|uniref:DUF397 domain-containing protein n=1 Tax=Streptomyces sp. JJ38 TaxID=2738128 RepID=UPI001C55CA9A|nr:DUF397 domain-containing protein [Streptomyces sp. JJ38]MBW1597798.1 DUF397 domain-containing protein [Streptomyces sp. JJ38]